MPYAYRRTQPSSQVASQEVHKRYRVRSDSDGNPFYTSTTTVTARHAAVHAVKYSSAKQNGDRRNATTYAAVTVYTGYATSGWSTHNGGGFQDHSVYTGVIRTSPYLSAGVFGISPNSSSRNLTVPSQDVAWARSLAASNAIGAEFSLLTTLAEMKQTVQGIADIASKLARAAASLKRGRIKGALRHLGYSPEDISALRNRARADLSDRAKAVADMGGEAHLMFRYGILPIIYDYDALRKLWEDGIGLTHFFVVKGSTKRSNSRREYIGDPVNERTIDDSYTVRFKACYAVDTRHLAVLSLLGTTDLLGTLWELVPYGFVVDWALNIGDFLRGLQSPLGMTYRGGHVSVKGTTTIAYTKPASNAYTKWHRPATRCEGYIRQGLGTPSVSLRFRNPFENSDNITTALALINQRMR